MTAAGERNLRAARLLCERRLARTPVGPLPEHCRPRTEAEGYAVQDALHRLLSEAGRGRVIGRKIGCTTAVMQRYLGIANPCAGGILATTAHHGAARVPHAGHVRPGAECEIAVRLGRALEASAAPFDRTTVAPAVLACLVAMEIVDDRYRDYRTLGVPTLVADDFFDAGCVLGPDVVDWPTLDLPALTGTTVVNGVETGRGIGGAVMGHPLEALAWLANARAARGLGLAAGEVVLLGSVVEVHWVAPGDHVRVRVDGLGEVETVFEA